MAIQLNLSQPEAFGDVNEEQVQALISVISSMNPPLLVLPPNKTYQDIQMFRLVVNEQGRGNLLIKFK